MVPDGKSLLSMMMHANFQLAEEEKDRNDEDALVHRVKEAAHKAFWTELRIHLFILFILVNRIYRQ